jgi:hypothetical protein
MSQTLNRLKEEGLLDEDGTGLHPVCAENLIRVDGVNESPKLAQ